MTDIRKPECVLHSIAKQFCRLKQKDLTPTERFVASMLSIHDFISVDGKGGFEVTEKGKEEE